MQVFSVFWSWRALSFKSLRYNLWESWTSFWETPLLNLLSTTLRTWNSLFFARHYKSTHFLKGRCIPLYQFLQLLRGLGEGVKYHTLLSIAGNHFGGSHSLWLYDSSWFLAEFLSQLKIIALVNHRLCECVASKGWSLISFQKEAVINPERVGSYTWSRRGWGGCLTCCHLFEGSAFQEQNQQNLGSS